MSRWGIARRAANAAACVVVGIALLTTGMSGDTGSGGTPAKKPGIVVDGSHWTAASAGERRAFLVGVGNMIVAEMAYADRHELEPPPAGDRIVKAVADLKLPDIELRITRWYEAHPEQEAMPVMGVIWQEFVKKNEAP